MRPQKTSQRLQYIQNLFAQEDDLLKDIQQRVERDSIPIQIGAEEGKFLQILVQMIGAQSIVEIGTLAGYSTIWLARALGDNGHIYTIEHSTERAKMAKESFAKSEVAHKITLIEGEAEHCLPSLESQAPFDLIFIDADKNNYCKYLDWADENIRQGGLIVADNTMLFEAVYLDGLPDGIRQTTLDNMREFNIRTADESKYQSIMLPTKEGLTIAIKK